MMKAVVYDAKQKLKNLHAFLSREMPHDAEWEISDVKRDGTVFVKFKSTKNQDASAYADEFGWALDSDDLAHERVDDVKLRLALDQFASDTNSV